MELDSRMAAMLLSSMLERLQNSDNKAAVSTFECQALAFAIQVLGADKPALQAVMVPADRVDTPDSPLTTEPQPAIVRPKGQLSLPKKPAPEPTPEPALVVAPPPAVPALELDLSSLDRDQPSLEGYVLCLDFGTAMSKAFARKAYQKYLELELGTAAGESGFLLPSSIFIGDDKKVYFGVEALRQSEREGHAGHKRLDSIKSHLSQRTGADIDYTWLELSENPHAAELPLTHGDAIRLYLAYFIDIAVQALARYPELAGENTRHVLRRYAHPCWPDTQQAAASTKMQEMMEQAQILADTFSGQWSNGIPLQKLREALKQVKTLQAMPHYLLDKGIPEPVAVAGSIVYDTEHQRDAFMVVDVGAGTTDFGLFIVVKKDDDDVVVHQVGDSVMGLMQAGDKVDSLLRFYIATKEGIDRDDAHGGEVMADLARRIRGLKEALFRTGRVEYVLSDGSTGIVYKNEFLDDERVVRFASVMQDAFTKSLSKVDDSWLKLLSNNHNMTLKVAVTGGSAPLDMMQALSHGEIDVNGHTIKREPLDVRPDWLDEHPALDVIYPQLAVAIGGTAEVMPRVDNAPQRLYR